MNANYFQALNQNHKKYLLMNFFQEIDTHFCMKIQYEFLNELSE